MLHMPWYSGGGRSFLVLLLKCCWLWYMPNMFMLHRVLSFILHTLLSLERVLSVVRPMLLLTWLSMNCSLDAHGTCERNTLFGGHFELVIFIQVLQWLMLVMLEHDDEVCRAHLHVLLKQALLMPCW